MLTISYIFQEPCCSTSWQILEFLKETFKVQNPPPLIIELSTTKKKKNQFYLTLDKMVSGN